MRILAIDAAKNVLGYAILEDEKLLDYGIIDSKNKDIYDVIKKQNLIFSDLIKKYDIDEVVVEDIFVGNNRKTALVLGKMHGGIILTAAQHDLKITYYTVASVRKSLYIDDYQLASNLKQKGISSEDKKKFIQSKVFSVVGELFNKDLNISDAIAVGLCHINSHKKEE